MDVNHVTIFSTGIADFRRHYEVKRNTPLTISIPVRTEYVGDVLASMCVFGDVTIKSPPSYRPASQHEGNLAIEPSKGLDGLAKSLSGAKVEIDRAGETVTGTLVGIDVDQQTPQGRPGQPGQPTMSTWPVKVRHWVVLTQTGVQTLRVNEIGAIRFPEPAVQAEIDKALARLAQRITPHSTIVELTVKTDEILAEAVVQYTIPAAAWKISYRLRNVSTGGYELQGFAIVDNNTDEDWQRFNIAVVTGEPITFSTDLARSKTPRRRHVNVVRDEALGAVEVEEGMVDYDMLMAPGGCEVAMAAALEDQHEQIRRHRGMVCDAAGAAAESSYSSADLRAAKTDEMQAHEVGDFCVFRSARPVTIGAGRSAVIPVFQQALGKVSTVLHYNEAKHPDRPYRAIRLVNETDYSLGRGVCTVFDEGTYAGSCVMPAVRPGDDCLLPHALETGVRIHRRQHPTDRELVGISLSEGIYYQTVRRKCRTVYNIENRKDEKFELTLDHTDQLHDATVEATVTRKDGRQTMLDPTELLFAGRRYSIPLSAGETLSLTLGELAVDETAVRLVDTGKLDQVSASILDSSVLTTDGPLAGNPDIRACLDLQKQLDAKAAEITQATEKIRRLIGRQDRLRKNISAGAQDQQTARWRSDLGDVEGQIVDLEENVLPKLAAEQDDIRKRLRDALMGLAIEWRAEE